MSTSGNMSKDAEETSAVSPMKAIKDLGSPYLMTRKFIEAEQSNYPYPPSRVQTFRKEFHFFYGTLMDRQTLAKVLQHDNLPPLVPAKISGYH